MTEARALVRGLADAYGRGADAYAAVLDPALAQLAQDTVEIAAISAPQRVLDLATGTGAVARTAARAGARVVAIDLSPGMTTTARRLSPTTIGFAVADAATLPFRPHAFDAVTCGLSLSHFADARRVLMGVRAVLRPGGVLVASCWGTSGGDPAYSAVFAVYKRRTGNLPRPFSALLDEATWSDPKHSIAMMLRSGFASAAVVTRRVTGTYGSPLAVLEWALAWPLTAAGFQRLDAERREALRSEALAAVEAAGRLEWERSVHYYLARV